jgi:hypothetical protein
MRRIGFGLCALGVLLGVGIDLLPIELFVGAKPHTYLRVVPGEGFKWLSVAGYAFLALGVALIVWSMVMRKNRDDAT